jgi:hypothetical protein
MQPVRQPAGIGFIGGPRLWIGAAAVFLLLLVQPLRAQVTLDLRDADLRNFVEIVSEATGRSFVLDPGVRGTVTVLAAVQVAALVRVSPAAPPVQPRSALPWSPLPSPTKTAQPAQPQPQPQSPNKFGRLWSDPDITRKRRVCQARLLTFPHALPAGQPIVSGPAPAHAELRRRAPIRTQGSGRALALFYSAVGTWLEFWPDTAPQAVGSGQVKD